MVSRKSFPSQGDIIWISLDPTVGREQQGRRPVIVISATKFNNATGFVLVVPLTSRARSSKLGVVVRAVNLGGVALTTYVRSFDLQSRAFELSGEKCPLKELAEICSIVSSVVDVRVE